MDRNPGLLHWEHETLRVEAFCRGAEGILDNPDPDSTQDNQLTKEDGPEAWVSDRNYWLSQDGISRDNWYDEVLDRLGFYQVLKNEVRVPNTLLFSSGNLLTGATLAFPTQLSRRDDWTSSTSVSLKIISNCAFASFCFVLT